MRPVTQIGRTHVTLQFFTRQPSPTRVQIRQSDLPMTAWRPTGQKLNPWNAATGVRIVEGTTGRTARTFHTLRIEGLQPGRRYFYRVYDAGAKPTAQEAKWGAQTPWRREFAFSTLAPPGWKTIIHLPVKVLLMTNVVNVASAHTATGAVPPPPALTPAQLEIMRREYAVASRFFWVNSGMRYWVDFQIQIDPRPQRWGPEPPNVDAAYRGWLPSRAYAGEDFRAPGGGAFNIVDTRDPLRANTAPVFEARPFAAQIEQAFVRRWNDKARKWEFYNSGGGTLGVDGFPGGVPGRSQYLGGGDTAWLAAHEFHHQMESQGAFSFANREDERIAFDHPEPRRRTTRADGTTSDNAWNTSGRHGEHWDVLAFWDRTLSDAQWLRIYFGETLTVADADEDGVPDADARLPLDERRFGSDPRRRATDGRLNDLSKVMLSTWAPASLQYSLNKPPFQSLPPRPANPDSDGDGTTDDVDPYPLIPFAPFVWPLSADIEGDASEWNDVPPSGAMNEGGMSVTFKQGHDEAGYYGLFALQGPWQRLRVTLDGEGRGVFSGEGIQGFEVLRGADDTKPTVRPQWGSAPGLTWRARRGANGATLFAFRFPNRGEGLWFWNGGGREIGASVEVAASDGKIYSMYEPYQVFYARMLERAGRAPLPTGAPQELTRQSATRVLLPGDAALKFTGAGWRVDNGRLTHRGEDESAAYIDGLHATEFDLWMEFEAKQDAILGAFAAGTTEMIAGRDYFAFVGGYAHTVTRLSLSGS